VGAQHHGFPEQEDMATEHSTALRHLARLLAEIAYRQLKKSVVESQQPQITKKAA
jgi:hypothetical protein